jgi:hypothetical protein
MAAEVEAVETQYSVPSIGYCLREDERLGRFNREAAVALWSSAGATSEGSSTAKRSLSKEDD